MQNDELLADFANALQYAIDLIHAVIDGRISIDELREKVKEIEKEDLTN